MATLFLRDDCIQCTETPVCNCAAGQECFQINRDCYTCATIQCKDPATSASKSSSGVSKGALAGAIVGVLLFLALVAGLYFWYRRSPRFAARRGDAPEVKEDVPAAAADVLNRPDPTEKALPPPSATNTVRHYPGSSTTTIDLDPNSQHSSSAGHQLDRRSSAASNPFADNHSIQTAGTEGTNVIPIALVSPDARSDVSSSPSRPARSPELQLNLDHVNVSNDNLRRPHGAPSERSGVSGMSNIRNSYMTGASYASELLNEAPMIMTPTKGNVRHVLGTVKAEVIDARGSNTDGLRTPLSARPSVGSPLAATSFGPSDFNSRDSSSSRGTENPFSDAHVSTQTVRASSPSASVTTFGQPSPDLRESHTPNWADEGSLLPWEREDVSRPTSMSTQAGSVIDIGSATRVNISSGASPLYRTTIGRLVTPSTAGTGTLEEQQQKALAHAQARAQAQGFEPTRRTSGTSAISATADSILEAFPFVPPSPISNRPTRSPPVSPLGQQTFSITPATPEKQTFDKQQTNPPNSKNANDSDLPAPPNRRTLGLSTGSQLSTASSGLGSFPFQIDSEQDGAAAPTAYNGGRQRASLDTLAITSDLSSYPLGFDRDSNIPPPRR